MPLQKIHKKLSSINKKQDTVKNDQTYLEED